MNDLLAATIGIGSAALFSVFLLRAAALRSASHAITAYKLRFPKGLEVAGVESFLAGLSGLLLPWWKRWLVTPYVVVEVHATARGIEHFVVVPEAWAKAVENVLQASVPSVRYEPTPLPFAVLNVGAEYRLSTSLRPLRVDAAGMSARLLSSLQPLTGDECVVVQWCLTPHPPVAPVKNPKPQNADTIPYLHSPVDGEAAAALRTKYQSALLLGAPRIGIGADDVRRARHLLRQAETAWHEGRAPGVHFERRLMSEATVARRMIQRRVPFVEWPGAFGSVELAGLIGWPVDAVAIPGLILGGCRLVPASPLIPSTGTVVGDALFPGDVRPLALDTEARLRHTHIVGPTGTGKSTLLCNMIVSDIAAGYGVVVLDGKGDLVEAVLERLPAWRQDIIVLSPADGERPVGFNPLHAVDADQAEVVVENLVGLFKSLYRYSWGPRLDDILRAALLTLTTTGKATLCEVPLILNDPTYRRRLVGRLDDPTGLESFWGWYESISDAERQVALGPVMNKVRAITMRPRIRSIIGQSDPKLDMSEVVNSGKVLLVSLASGLLGEEAAALMGALVVAELWHATTARAGLPPARRRPVMAYVDEWQKFVHLPTPMGEVLAEARGLGLGMVLAHQTIVGQLPDDVRHAVLANARSRVAFALPSEDARLVARELGGIFTADDLQGLGPYEVVCQLFAAGSTQPPATARTRPLPEPSSDPDEIRRASRERYGVDRGEVEMAIRGRQSRGTDAPIGRRRRREGRT